MQLIPNAKAQFIDSGGQPLANGTVGFYFPGTLNPKATYQDMAGTIANPNPVPLDSRGQALIWGSGVYRQILKDASGVTIWDQVTEDPNAGLTGNMTDAKYVAGTDYVPGTTTQLTLPAGPGTVSNTWVFFDTAYQADDQYSVNGTTLTFNAPIPVGVQEVNIKIGSTIAVGTPGAGTVTDASVAAGAGIQSSKLSFLQAGFGAVSRTVQSKERDIVSVMDFGADPLGVKDSLAAFVAAKASIEATGKAGTVYIPNGVYKISGTIGNDRSSDATVPVVSWKGAGSDSTRINYTGTGILFNIVGNTTLASFYGKISGMTLLGAGLANTFCFGTTLCSFFRFSDLTIESFDYAFYGQDIDHTLYEMMTVRFNNQGFFARENPTPGPNSTCPNQLTFVQCSFSSNVIYGIDIEQGAANTFVGCQFEVNGASNAHGWGVKVNGSSLQGGPAIIRDGCYFESNNGDADLILVSVDANLNPPISDATYVLNGTSFNRASGTYKATNSILTNFGPSATVGQQILVLNGCTFKGFNSYVPNAGTPYINYSGTQTRAKNNFFTTGCVFQSAIEAPTAVQNPAKSYLQAGKSTSQSIPNNAATTWAIDTVQIGFSWATAIAGNAITVPEPGCYHIDCTLTFASPVGGAIQVIIFDGATVIAAEAVASGQQVVSCGTTKTLAAGDVLTVQITQQSGASQTLAGGNASFLTITKMIDG